MTGIFRVCNTRTVHCWKRETLRIPTMYRTPAAEIIPPSFCHITSFHGTSHLPSGSRNDCMHDCSHWVNHHSECPKIYSFLRTPRAPEQLSTCGKFLQVGSTAVQLGKYPVWRDQFTGAGRLSATPSYFNSKQTYSTRPTHQVSGSELHSSGTGRPRRPEILSTNPEFPYSH